MRILAEDDLIPTNPVHHNHNRCCRDLVPGYKRCRFNWFMVNGYWLPMLAWSRITE